MACDGPDPEHPGKAKKVSETRQVIKQEIDWHCQIDRLYSVLNQGCRLGVSRAITWFFEQEQKAGCGASAVATSRADSGIAMPATTFGRTRATSCSAWLILDNSTPEITNGTSPADDRIYGRFNRRSFLSLRVFFHPFDL